MGPPGLSHKAPQQLKTAVHGNMRKDGVRVCKNHTQPDSCMLMHTEELRIVKQDEYHPSLVLHLMAV